MTQMDVAGVNILRMTIDIIVRLAVHHIVEQQLQMTELGIEHVLWREVVEIPGAAGHVRSRAMQGVKIEREILSARQTAERSALILRIHR